MIFIPSIAFSGYVILCHLVPQINVGFNVPLIGNQMCAAAVLYPLILLAYFRVDFITGLVYTLWSYAQMVDGESMYKTKEANTIEVFGEQHSLLAWCTVFHIISWIM